jgi:hypothetical protein
MSTGAGILTLFIVDTSRANSGLFMASALVSFSNKVAQAAVPLSQVSIGTATVTFVQMLGGALIALVA